MSFGFGVGDFLATAELAWNLYQYCYKVARGAPHEFQLLLSEIATLSQSIRLLEQESTNPDSLLLRAGEDRIRMVKEMMERVGITLKALEKHARKYEKLGDVANGMKSTRRRLVWERFKWSVDASDLDGLRTKLVYHNGVINLLLTSVGNSSLERIESSALKIETKVTEIKNLIKSGTEPFSPPVISVVDDEFFKISLGATLMKYAEIVRPWPAVGVGDWIQAGRWWLLKAQMELYAGLSSAGTVSRQGYINLIKASWILIDIITRHPQLNFLDSSIRYEIELLAEALKEEFENIEKFQKPSLEDFESDDLQIWETQSKGPSLQPGRKSLNSSLSQTREGSWVIADEHVCFQRFGSYQSNRYSTKTPCIVLFLMHKRDKMARIVLQDQNWITLATFPVGKKGDSSPINNVVKIDDQEIILSTPQDASLLCVISEVAGEYMSCSNRKTAKDYEIFQAFVLLQAVKKREQDVVNWLLGGEKKDHDQGSISCRENPNSVSILLAAKTLASKYVIGESSHNSNRLEQGSLFSWAARKGHNRIVQLLLELKGIIISETAVPFWTSIHNAARDGQQEAISFLLAEGEANVDEREDGFTPLQKATQRGDKSMIEYLLTVGADINTKPSEPHGLTALQAAANRGHEAIVSLLLEAGADINAKPSRRDGLTALQAASKEGHGAIVNLLLKSGADINAKPSRREGLTALQAAAKGGHQTIVTLLLATGADINAKPSSWSGLTALQAAAKGGHEVVVNLLLAAGADTNAKPSELGGLTALQAASKGGHEATVKLLLTAGADINAAPAMRDGLTALQAAAQVGNANIGSLLLTAGADVNAEPSIRDGLTALQAAAQGGHGDVVKFFLAAGADINAEPSMRNGLTALQAAAAGGHESVVKLLLAAGADVNAKPSSLDGLTALQAAASGGNVVIVDLLLAAGADVNAKPSESGGATALQAAMKAGGEAVVERLLAVGAK